MSETGSNPCRSQQVRTVQINVTEHIIDLHRCSPEIGCAHVERFPEEKMKLPALLLATENIAKYRSSPNHTRMTQVRATVM